jgi:hypothetical protein
MNSEYCCVQSSVFECRSFTCSATSDISHLIMTEARDTTKVQCKRVRSCTLNTYQHDSLNIFAPETALLAEFKCASPHGESEMFRRDGLAPAKLSNYPCDPQSGACLTASSKPCSKHHFGEPTSLQRWVCCADWPHACSG